MTCYRPIFNRDWSFFETNPKIDFFQYRILREFLNLKICVSLHFRSNDTPILARGFIHQNANVPRTTAPCIPKCENARFATAACAKMYESRTSPDPLRAMKNVRFYYSFGRSTPRFYREGCASKMKFAFRSFERSTARFKREGCRGQNEICVSLQFWAIDTTFLTRGLPRAK